MIAQPRRAVTRFFVPLIDVLILLFCIFLLMPFVSGPPAPEPEPEGKTPPPPAAVPDDVKELQRQLREAWKRISEYERDRLSVADKLVIRLLEIDPDTGHLWYYDPGRQKVEKEEDALALVKKLQRDAGAKPFKLLLAYPRKPGRHPDRGRPPPPTSTGSATCRMGTMRRRRAACSSHPGHEPGLA